VSEIRLELDVLAATLSIVRLPVESEAPTWASGSSFLSTTRTAGELSVVCDSALVPSGVRAEHGFRSLAVRGPLAFSEVGLLDALAAPLARAKIGIFMISTFDTDYLLVREESLGEAIQVLGDAGHSVYRS